MVVAEWEERGVVEGGLEWVVVAVFGSALLFADFVWLFSLSFSFFSPLLRF